MAPLRQGFTSRDREEAVGRDTRTTACLRARLVSVPRYTPVKSPI